MFRISIALLFATTLATAQHRGISYQLSNEIGTYKLSSLTFSHRIDNEEGFSFVTDKAGKDTLYQIDQFLNGYVGLSNDGRTIVHVQSEQFSKPLKNLVIAFYRNGKLFDEATLGRLLKYELDDVNKREALPASGWLRNDSLLHKMASNAFYITDDKVFVSTDGPILQVFDMNQMFHIFTGNGANHFYQNYYAIPNLPFRTEFSTSEYFPKSIPASVDQKQFSELIETNGNLKITDPESAIYRLDVDLFVNQSGNSEIRSLKVFNTKTNTLNTELSSKLKESIPDLEYQTTSVPPNHPGWIFSQSFWLR